MLPALDGFVGTRPFFVVFTVEVGDWHATRLYDNEAKITIPTINAAGVGPGGLFSAFRTLFTTFTFRVTSITNYQKTLLYDMLLTWRENCSPVEWPSSILLADTKFAEDTLEQIITGSLSSHFAKSIISCTQINGDKIKRQCLLK